jgi:SAM-dependent methyltransferase
MNTGSIDLARAQQERWQSSYVMNPGLNGREPSASAVRTAELFAAGGIDDVLELGAGTGRDSLYFAKQGMSVQATDFSDAAVELLRLEAQRAELSERVTAALHDVRDPLPAADGRIGAVYAHRVLGMALSRDELRSLMTEIRRVLRPGGILVYTVLSMTDGRQETGVKHDDELFGDGLFGDFGIAERYFDRELIDSLATGWAEHEVEELTDGAPERRLWHVIQRKAS